MQIGSSALREAVIRLGAKAPASLIRRISTACNDIQLVGWMHRMGMTTDRVVDGRDELYEIVAADIGDQSVCYLEFGVAAGDATRVWSKLLTHPDTVLHGFDTFEGLPEAWTADLGKGAFSQEGRLPEIDDRRVTFFKGLFDEVLPGYTVPVRDHYVLNLDADLFTSTIYVLRKLAEVIKPGTYLYFDEFSSPGHEERAFREFVEESGLQFDLVGASRGRWHMLFRCR